MLVEPHVLGWLATHALNELAEADQDAGCCPVCCAPCAAVAALVQSGQIDRAVRPYALGYEWWDEASREVDREFLSRAWRMRDCHIDRDLDDSPDEDPVSTHVTRFGVEPRMSRAERLEIASKAVDRVRRWEIGRTVPMDVVLKSIDVTLDHLGIAVPDEPDGSAVRGDGLAHGEDHEG